MKNKRQPDKGKGKNEPSQDNAKTESRATDRQRRQEVRQEVRKTKQTKTKPLRLVWKEDKEDNDHTFKPSDFSRKDKDTTTKAKDKTARIVRRLKDLVRTQHHDNTVKDVGSIEERLKVWENEKRDNLDRDEFTGKYTNTQPATTDEALRRLARRKDQEDFLKFCNEQVKRYSSFIVRPNGEQEVIHNLTDLCFIKRSYFLTSGTVKAIQEGEHNIHTLKDFLLTTEKDKRNDYPTIPFLLWLGFSDHTIKETVKRNFAHKVKEVLPLGEEGYLHTGLTETAQLESHENTPLTFRPYDKKIRTVDFRGGQIARAVKLRKRQGNQNGRDRYDTADKVERLRYKG